MGRSLESARPMLASSSLVTPRSSQRFSTYSDAPSTTHAGAASPTRDAKVADIRSYTARLERLEDKRLSQQRYVVSPQKDDNMAKLALGAKLDRALDRRLTSQDAVFRPKVLNEKQLAEGKATA